jgi:hypothetical protein
MVDGGRAAPTPELAHHEVGALAAHMATWWAIVDGDEVWRAEGDAWGRAAGLGRSRANCLCPTSAGLLIGTSEARLARLVDRDVQAVESFDRTPGRDDWYTPWGGPPDVRTISLADDGTIHANVHVGGIVRSRDDGATWEPTLEIDADVHEVLAPAGHDRLVVAACARGLAISEDGGDSWRYETEGLHANYCRAVAVGDGTLYLSASQGPRGGRAALYRRPITGATFDKCAEGLPEWLPTNIDSMCVAAAGSTVAFGTDEGTVFGSEDSGATWDAWAEGLPPVRCLAFD